MSLSLISKVLAFSLLTATVTFAQKGPNGKDGGHHRGPQLTDTQKTCLESKIGKPSEGSERPSKESMDAAFTACGIEKPAFGGEGKDGDHHRGPKLTDAQKQCMDTEVGSPESSTRPSREAMEAAMKKCGVEAPPHGSGQRDGQEKASSDSSGDSAKFAQLTEAYLASSDSAVQDARRADLKALFFKTKDQNLKQQIQVFLSSHLPTSVATATETESVSSRLSSEGGSR